MRFGLSGTAGFGLSGTRDSDFRERAILAKPQKSSRNRPPSNDANRKESFGFLLTLLQPVDNLGATGLLNAHVKLVGFAVAGARP